MLHTLQQAYNTVSVSQTLVRYYSDKVIKNVCVNKQVALPIRYLVKHLSSEQ